MTTNPLSSPVVLVRNPSLFASQVDDELVMMDETQGRYYGLNPVGRAIWELLESPRSYDSILASLAQSHDVERERCDSEVRPFLERMIELKLLHVATP